MKILRNFRKFQRRLFPRTCHSSASKFQFENVRQRYEIKTGDRRHFQRTSEQPRGIQFHIFSTKRCACTTFDSFGTGNIHYEQVWKSTRAKYACNYKNITRCVIAYSRSRCRSVADRCGRQTL